LSAGFCPKNLARARKIMASLDSGRLQSPDPLPGSINQSINQSIKTDLYSAVCRKRIRGAR